ncbi:MAG: hypothetical protein ACRDYB_02105 [Acidimicrobiales bacterium]
MRSPTCTAPSSCPAPCASAPPARWPRSASSPWSEDARHPLGDEGDEAGELPAAADGGLNEDGDDTTGGYGWPNPRPCLCGWSWDVHDASALLNAKLTGPDIATRDATRRYPDTPAETCDGDRQSVVQGRDKRFRTFKNKTTGQLWLLCTKRVR